MWTVTETANLFVIATVIPSSCTMTMNGGHYLGA